jgi:hypothetical protein
VVNFFENFPKSSLDHVVAFGTFFIAKWGNFRHKKRKKKITGWNHFSKLKSWVGFCMLSNDRIFLLFSTCSFYVLFKFPMGSH